MEVEEGIERINGNGKKKRKIDTFIHFNNSVLQ